MFDPSSCCNRPLIMKIPAGVPRPPCCLACGANRIAQLEFTTFPPLGRSAFLFVFDLNVRLSKIVAAAGLSMVLWSIGLSAEETPLSQVRPVSVQRGASRASRPLSGRRPREIRCRAFAPLAVRLLSSVVLLMTQLQLPRLSGFRRPRGNPGRIFRLCQWHRGIPPFQSPSNH